MSDTKPVRVHGGLSTLSLLGILFVALKLTGNVTWSWLWVTAPFWGGAALVLAIVFALAAVGGIAMVAGGVINAVRDVRKQRRDGIR